MCLWFHPTHLLHGVYGVRNVIPFEFGRPQLLTGGPGQVQPHVFGRAMEKDDQGVKPYCADTATTAP